MLAFHFRNHALLRYTGAVQAKPFRFLKVKKSEYFSKKSAIWTMNMLETLDTVNARGKKRLVEEKK